MKPTKWNTPRIAGYGALCGIIITLIRDYAIVLSGDIGAAVGLLVGGAVGGAILFAIVSGLRNLFVR